MNHLLFTVYHLWQPQNYATIILGISPLVWATWRWRCVKTGVVTHVLLNLIGALLSFGLILKNAG